MLGSSTTNGYAKLPFPLKPDFFSGGDFFMGLWVYNQQSERINQAIVDVYNASSSEEEPGASFGDDFLLFFF